MSAGNEPMTYVLATNTPPLRRNAATPPRSQRRVLNQNGRANGNDDGYGDIDADDDTDDAADWECGN